MWKTNKTRWITPLTKLAPTPQLCGKLTKSCGKLRGKNVNNYFWLIIYLVFSLQYEGLSVNMLLVKMTCPSGSSSFLYTSILKGEMKLLFEHFISYRAELSNFNYSKLKIKNQFFKCSLATTIIHFADYSNS